MHKVIGDKKSEGKTTSSFRAYSTNHHLINYIRGLIKDYLFQLLP